MPAKDDAIMGRGNDYKVNPNMIACDHEYNSRIRQVPKEKVEELAASIVEYGQIHPCILRRDRISKDESVLRIVSGYTRVEAVRLINSRASLLSKIDAKQLKDGILPVYAKMQECDETEAFIRSIIENKVRENATAVDDAHNQQRLRAMGMKNKDIAALYKIAPSQVSMNKRILELSNEHQMMLHEGKISYDLALRLSDLDESERKNIVDNLSCEDEEKPKVSMAEATKEAKKLQREKGIKTIRSPKEVREFLRLCSKEGTSYHENDKVNKKFKWVTWHVLQYISGDIDDDVFINGVIGLIDEKEM